MKQVVLYLTNKSNEWTLSAFHALEQSLQGVADVYYAYHQQGVVLPVSLQNIENQFVFTSDILSELGYTPIEEGKLVPGSNHFPLLKFFKENQGYDYYWLVEDDVRFSGEWKEFFGSFASCTSDFLSSVIETKAENPNWYWWTSLKTGNAVIAEEKLLKSFNPIYRLSRQALTCIDAHLRIGWMGHHEVLLPTLLYNKGFLLEDFGGDGSFVRQENKSKFYDLTSMRIAPVLPDDRKNYLFHPVKEEKIRLNGSYKKNAVFVAAGEGSLHRQLLKGNANFDLHLLIYDGSYSKFCNDTDFIACDAGYKMDMTYRYLHRHPDLLNKYEYFFLMDDDIEMSTEEVNKLFGIMKQYHLRIAQPSLVMSYYTYEHTLHNPFCILRYTNFVEMMIPCFSKEALIKVLPTFEEKICFKGIEYHWAKMVGNGIAIIDIVKVVHTRPVHSFSIDCFKKMKEYLTENHLNKEIQMYSSVPFGRFSRDFSNLTRMRDEIVTYGYETIGKLIFTMKYSELIPVVVFYCLYALATERKSLLDIALRAIYELYYKHREDYNSRISKEELRKLSIFLSCYSKYNPLVNVVFKFLEKQDIAYIPSLSEGVKVLCLCSDYEKTELLDSLRKGIDMCLVLINRI